MKQYLTAKEVAEVTGASQGKAYGIIRELNEELKAAGYITIAGKVPVGRNFRKKYYGFEGNTGGEV